MLLSFSEFASLSIPYQLLELLKDKSTILVEHYDIRADCLNVLFSYKDFFVEVRFATDQEMKVPQKTVVSRDLLYFSNLIDSVILPDLSSDSEF